MYRLAKLMERSSRAGWMVFNRGSSLAMKTYMMLVNYIHPASHTINWSNSRDSRWRQQHAEKYTSTMDVLNQVERLGEPNVCLGKRCGRVSGASGYVECRTSGGSRPPIQTMMERTGWGNVKGRGGEPLHGP